LTHDQAGFEAIKQRTLALYPEGRRVLQHALRAGEPGSPVQGGRRFRARGRGARPRDWDSWGKLGMNQLRLGQIAEGKKSLDASFAGDPYNVWVKNTLDLLDTFKNYDLVTSDHFQFMIEKDESPILSIY
jgi:hypothetical protein